MKGTEIQPYFTGVTSLHHTQLFHQVTNTNQGILAWKATIFVQFFYQLNFYRYLRVTKKFVVVGNHLKPPKQKNHIKKQKTKKGTHYLTLNIPIV